MCSSPISLFQAVGFSRLRGLRLENNLRYEAMDRMFALVRFVCEKEYFWNTLLFCRRVDAVG